MTSKSVVLLMNQNFISHLHVLYPIEFFSLLILMSLYRHKETEFAVDILEQSTDLSMDTELFPIAQS